MEQGKGEAGWGGLLDITLRGHWGLSWKPCSNARTGVTPFRTHVGKLGRRELMGLQLSSPEVR